MIAAFFDIDGTLYRYSLLGEHFKKLVKYEVIDPIVWIERVESSFSKWTARIGDYEVFLEDLAAAYVESLKGVALKDIEFIAHQVIQKTWEKTYKYTRKRIEWHHKQNHKIIFISGSPDFLVSKLAIKYGVQEFKASKYLLDDQGIFQGSVVPMWDAKSKSRAIEEYIEKFNIDMNASYSYGDTMGDITMLRATGNPIAINPNHRLIDCVQKDQQLYEKIKVVIERKDVVYQVDAKENIIF